MIKTPEQIKKIRASCKLLARIFSEIDTLIKPGITGVELDRIVEEKILGAGAMPSFKNYEGFPSSICISINDVIVHGIPNNQEFQEGDIVGIDTGLCLDGAYSDMARTYPIGKVEANAQRLINVTKECIDKALEVICDGAHIGDIGAAVQGCAEKAGFGVIRKFVGHGVGNAVHEEPKIPNFGKKGEGIELKAGMILAIEPMISEGSYEIVIDEDGWTARMADGKKAAHFEHTILVTKDGGKILTTV